MLGIASAFGTSAVPGKGELNSKPIRIRGVSRQTGPIVVKVVGTDLKGHRVSAWADFNVGPSPNHPPHPRTAVTPTPR
jgi:hypothetical protein